MQQQKHAEAASDRAVAWSWDEGQLRAAAVTLDGYAAEAGLGREPLRPDAVLRQASQAGTQFVQQTSGQLQALVARQAQRHCGWFTRLRYEVALLLMLGLILYRLGRNFFWDSWLAVDFGFRENPAPVLGLDFFVPALVLAAALVRDPGLGLHQPSAPRPERRDQPVGASLDDRGPRLAVRDLGSALPRRASLVRRGSTLGGFRQLFTKEARAASAAGAEDCVANVE